MRHIHTATHSDIETTQNKSIFQRKATRAIALRGEMILMLYTERYHDYSLPGGGLDEGEDLISGMIRELQEETGAKNIQDVREFGIYEEYRPWYKPDFDIQHMVSYCFTCTVDEELGDTDFEHYELSNGMKPVWINIHDAIEHNEETITSSEKKGMSIERETYLLHLIKKEVLVNS
ncbi:DNA mismatch repair protein MutT [Halobacteriovorax marinus]|uniref:DNA mismatch repair protein MutT n=1 Tax=Halobacteriovorax marinus TaxID=97084 RepID=A0A1Y5F821_9BACT|nr:DNA mismatch repair protein MutT [Halobacteriovorax marinus]